MTRDYQEILRMQRFRNGFWKICRRGIPHRSRALSQSIFERLVERRDITERQHVDLMDDRIDLPTTETSMVAVYATKAAEDVTGSSLGTALPEPPFYGTPIALGSEHKTRSPIFRCNTRSDTGPTTGQVARTEATTNNKTVEISFDERWWEDFSTGNPMMVAANDGTKDCAAIMPTVEMIERLMAAVNGNRRLAHKEQQADQRKEILSLKRERLTMKIAMIARELNTLGIHSRRRYVDKEAVTSAISNQSAAQDGQALIDARIDDLQAQMKFLEAAQKKVDERVDIIERCIKNELRGQRELELYVYEFTDFILTRSNILPPLNEVDDMPGIWAQDEVLDDDIEAVLVEHDRQISQPDDGQSPIMADLDGNQPGRDAVEDEVSQETEQQLRERQLYEELEDAKYDLEKAQFNFDTRDTCYDECLQEWHAAAANGQKVIPREKFDLLHLQRKRNLTRWLIDAEERLFELKAEAKEARLFGYSPGLDLGSEYSQCYDYDRRFEDLGYDDVEEEEQQESDWSGVERWVDSVARRDDDGDEVPVDIDDWDARLPVQMSDSASCFAQGIERRLLDRWRNDLNVSLAEQV